MVGRLSIGSDTGAVLELEKSGLNQPLSQYSMSAQNRQRNTMSTTYMLEETVLS